MKIIMMLAVLVGICFVSWAEDIKEDPPQRSITISAGNGPFVFGRPISLSVSYRNDAGNSWVVSSPRNSPSVCLHYRPSGSKQRPQGYSLGRIIYTPIKMPDGQVITARETPVSRQISIAPGKSHEFTIALERDWSGDLEPGLWSVWLEDEALDLRSNSIDIRLSFTADSAAACLDVAMDSEQQVYKRKEHAKWLRKLVPELDLRWPSDDTPEQERQKIEVQIRKELQAAEKSLSNKSNARAVEAAMENINRKVKEDGGSAQEVKEHRGQPLGSGVSPQE